METQTPQEIQKIQKKQMVPDKEKEKGIKMDFKRFKDVNINVKNINIKLNTGVFDRYTPAYSTTVKFDGCTHKVSVLRCGYLGLVFLLVNDVPTFQMYGSHQTILENLHSLNLPNEIAMQILKFAEYND